VPDPLHRHLELLPDSVRGIAGTARISSTLVGQLAASVSGRTSSHASLAVDWTPVALRDDGGFDLRVGAAPWRPDRFTRMA